MAGKTKIYNTTSSRALVLDSNNEIATSNTSEAQIGYLSTLTSDAQTQINGKVNKNPSILALGNFPVNSVIGTAAATVDTHNVAGITQTTAGITFTLPIPTSGLPQYFTVYNYSTSTQTIQGYSTVIGIGSFAQFFYDGSDWRVSASGGGGNIDNVLSYANLAAFPLVGGANVIYIAEDTNLLYRWNGISYVQVGGGVGTTNLGVANITSTTLDITSDTGTDATIPQATITDAGLLNATDKVKLNNTSGTNTGDQTATTLPFTSDTGLSSTNTKSALDELNTEKENKFKTVVSLGNFAVNGVIGSAASTVDIADIAYITQTTAGITVSLPIPTSLLPRDFAVHNRSASIASLQCAPGTAIGIGGWSFFHFDGTSWKSAETVSKAGDIMTGTLQIANTSPEIRLNETDTLTNFRCVVLAGISYIQGNDILLTGYNGIDNTSAKVRRGGINYDLLHSGSSIPITQFSNATAGSLISFNNLGVASYIPPGTSGQVLTTQGAGLEPIWQTPSGGGGGVNQNFLKNGSFTYAAYGSPVVITATGTRDAFASGWHVRRQTLIANNITTESVLANNIQWGRFRRTLSNTSVISWAVAQAVSFEKVAQGIAGRTVNLSFQARHGANWSSLTGMVVKVFTATTVDRTTGLPVTGYTGGTELFSYTMPTINTVAEPVSQSFAVPSNVLSLMVSFQQVNPVGTALAGDYFDIGEVKLEQGNVKTAFQIQTAAEIEQDLSEHLTVRRATIAGQAINGLQGGRYDNINNAQATMDYPLKDVTPTITTRAATILNNRRGGADTTTTVITFPIIALNAATLSTSVATNGTIGDASDFTFVAINDWIDIRAFPMATGI